MNREEFKRFKKIQRDLGNRIKELRLISEFSIEDIASMTGFARQTITSVENGGSTDSSHLIEIAKAIGVHPKELFNFDLLEVMNTELYNEFKLWSNVEDERISNYALLIDVKSIITQTNSFTLRPSDLFEPFEYEMPYSKIDDFQKTEWVRLGHYEVASKDEGGLRSRQFKSFGGMVFSEAEIDSKIFPYSDYCIYPFHIWGDIIPEFELDKTIVFAILQDDPLEFYKILWLNPSVVKLLGLRVENRDSGLVAINNSNEIVLKMRTWSCDYIGDRSNFII